MSWNEAQDFCGQTGFKLPTEAQWEYAARAGTRTAFHNGPIAQAVLCAPLDSVLDAIGWYCGNSGGRSHPVGGKAPNGFGIHDVAGNVLEGCEDVYDEGFYEAEAAVPERQRRSNEADDGSGLARIDGVEALLEDDLEAAEILAAGSVSKKAPDRLCPPGRDQEEPEDHEESRTSRWGEVAVVIHGVNLERGGNGQ